MRRFRGRGLERVEPGSEGAAPESALPPETPELDDYYVRQARLHPIDNRTGRRTRRRASPGPPTRSAGAANLDLLAAQDVVLTPSEGIPAYRMNAVAVIPGTNVNRLDSARAGPSRNPSSRPSVVKDKFGNNTLGRHLTCFEDRHPGWIFSKAKNFTFGTLFPVSHKCQFIVDALKCYKCDRVTISDSYSCKRAGHMLCGDCVEQLPKTWNENDARIFDFNCPICSDAGQTVGHKGPDWSRLLTAVQIKCDYNKETGCEAIHLLQQHVAHREECPKAWACLYCGDIFPLAEMVTHLFSHGLKLPELEVLEGKDPLTFTLELEIPFKGLPIRANDIPKPKRGGNVKKPEMSLRKINTGVGTFVVYQIKLAAWKFVWFLVFVGTEQEALEYEARFLISALLDVPGADSCQLNRRRMCVSKVLPWNLNLKKMLKRVSDEKDTALAIFDYDGKEDFNSYKSEAHADKPKRAEETAPRFSSNMTLTIRPRSKIMDKKSTRRYYNSMNLIMKDDAAQVGEVLTQG